MSALRDTSKQIILLSVVAFIFNFIWENVQAPLFQGYTSFWQNFSMCLLATIGDVVIILLVYFFVSLLKDNYSWISTLHSTDIFVLASVGFFIAILIEYRALLFDTWAYTSTMPIIPYVKVGLTPVLQMVLLLPLTMYIVKKISSTF